MFDASEFKVLRKDDNRRLFVFSSKREMESIFFEKRSFNYEGAIYTIVGTPIAIESLDPEYSFAYAVEVE